MTLYPTKSERIDKFLTEVFPDWSRSKIKLQIELGNVFVDNQTIKPSFYVEPGMKVDANLLRPPHSLDLEPVNIPFSIEYEDEYLMVINKPRGIAIHPAPSLKDPSLVNALLYHSEQLSYKGYSMRPGIVHRLDRETTGLLIVAKKEEVHFKLARDIKSKKTDRRYLAVVNKVPAADKFIVEGKMSRDPHHYIKMCLGNEGKDSKTYFKVLDRPGNRILLGARLTTGRTHQIRVHLQFVNSPILGDHLYGVKDKSFRGGMQLHSAYLNFVHPISKEEIAIQCAPPEDFYTQNIPWEKLIEW